PNPIVPGVRDVDIAVRVDDDILRGAQSGRGRRAPIAAEPRASSSSKRRDGSLHFGFSDARVAGVRNIEFPLRIHRDALRALQLSAPRGTVVATESLGPLSNNR